MNEEYVMQIKEDTSESNIMQNNTIKYKNFTESLSKKENSGLILLTFIMMIVPPIMPLAIGLYFDMGMNYSIWLVICNFIMWLFTTITRLDFKIRIDIISVILMGFIFIFEMIVLLLNIK